MHMLEISLLAMKLAMGQHTACIHDGDMGAGQCAMLCLLTIKHCSLPT